MKRKAITVLIVTAVLASGITACTTRDSYPIQVMKIAPGDAVRVTCMDIETMQEDTDFSSMYLYTDIHLTYDLPDDIDDLDFGIS